MEDFELESKSYFFPNRLTLFEQVSQSLLVLSGKRNGDRERCSRTRPSLLRCLMLAPARCGEL